MAQTSKVGTHRTTIKNSDMLLQVTYHETAVVTYNRHTGRVKLDTGGYFSATTKTRMNQTSAQFNIPFHVYQKNYEWFVSVPGRDDLRFSGDSVEFQVQ